LVAPLARSPSLNIRAIRYIVAIRARIEFIVVLKGLGLFERQP
jgi:hypothetical protein